MGYYLSGHFIEACDCTVICPCWVDDEPVGGHCTGLVAWNITEGTIDGTDVAGATVVSVSTHGGFRRDGNRTTTVLYVDTSGCKSEVTSGANRGNLLARAFSGKDHEGPLKGLAKVSGTVVATGRGRITVDGAAGKAGWTVTVRPPADPDGGAPRGEGPGGAALADGVVLVRADGKPQVFDTEHGRKEPMVLRHTALSLELGVPDAAPEVEAQQGGHLELNVGALPGGSLEVSSRSGMRGAFEYRHETADAPA